MKYSIIFLLLIGLNPLFATDIKWHNTYSKAIQQAKLQNKPILLVIEKKNCGFCTKLDEEVFKNEEVEKLLIRKFIPLKLTIGQHYIPAKFSSSVAPVTWFLNKDGSSDYKAIIGASYDSQQLIEAMGTF